jgi:hypothetical protein
VFDHHFTQDFDLVQSVVDHDFSAIMRDTAAENPLSRPGMLWWHSKEAAAAAAAAAAKGGAAGGARRPLGLLDPGVGLGRLSMVRRFTRGLHAVYARFTPGDAHRGVHRAAAARAGGILAGGRRACAAPSAFSPTLQCNAFVCPLFDHHLTTI